MGFEFVLTGSAYPWLLFSALFTGASLSRATRRTAVPGDPGLAERARTLKWVFFSLTVSLALLFALCAVFIPGPAGFGRPPQLFFHLAASGIFFLAFRFRKSFGIVILILLLAFAVTLFLFVQSLTAFTGETEIARVRVLGLGGEGGEGGEPAMTLELTSAEAEPRVLRLGGVYFAPVVRVIIFEDYMVFLGRRSWYRFEGLTSFDEDFRQQDIELFSSHSFGISKRLWDFYELHETRIPAVKSVQVEMDLKKVREFYSYSLMLQNDGGLQILTRD
jgi:hypothetical protein